MRLTLQPTEIQASSLFLNALCGGLGLDLSHQPVGLGLYMACRVLDLDLIRVWLHGLRF